MLPNTLYLKDLEKLPLVLYHFSFDRNKHKKVSCTSLVYIETTCVPIITLNSFCKRYLFLQFKKMMGQSLQVQPETGDVSLFVIYPLSRCIVVWAVVLLFIIFIWSLDILYTMIFYIFPYIGFVIVECVYMSPGLLFSL